MIKLGPMTVTQQEPEIVQAKAKVEQARQALEIAKNNLAFAKLSPAAKRVMLAADVLEQIRIKRLKPISQQYIVGGITYKAGRNVAEDGCKACAIGAMFVCAVDKPNFKIDLVDGFPYSEVSTDDHMEGVEWSNMRDALSSYFTVEQLGLIESAFECTMKRASAYFADVLTLDQFTKAQKFGRKYKVANRMIAIMKNIIRNKGTFKP